MFLKQSRTQYNHFLLRDSVNTTYKLIAWVTATCFDLQSHHQAKLRTMEFFTMWLRSFGIPDGLQCVLRLATCIYSGIAIYRFDIDRFSAYTVRNFWSRIKFHINNVIYFRIHRSPNYRFSALIICKSRSRRGILRMDRLKKKN